MPQAVLINCLRGVPQVRNENLIVAWDRMNSREKVKKVCRYAVEAYNLAYKPSSQIVRLERASLFVRPGVGQGAILLSLVYNPRPGGYGTKHLHPVSEGEEEPSLGQVLEYVRELPVPDYDPQADVSVGRRMEARMRLAPLDLDDDC